MLIVVRLSGLDSLAKASLLPPTDSPSRGEEPILGKRPGPVARSGDCTDCSDCIDDLEVSSQLAALMPAMAAPSMVLDGEPMGVADGVVMRECPGLACGDMLLVRDEAAVVLPSVLCLLTLLDDFWVAK